MGNLLIVFVLSIAFGFFLIFLLRKKPKLNSEITPPLSPALVGLNFDQVYNLTCSLLEKLGLQIKDTFRENENEADIHTENPTPLIGGPVIAHLSFQPSEGKVTSVDVMNFASNLVGDRRGKGLFITTGEFAPEVFTLPELPPMELIDGKKFGDLLQEHGLKNDQISK